MLPALNIRTSATHRRLFRIGSVLQRPQASTQTFRCSAADNAGAFMAVTVTVGLLGFPSPELEHPANASAQTASTGPTVRCRVPQRFGVQTGTMR